MYVNVCIAKARAPPEREGIDGEVFFFFISPVCELNFNLHESIDYVWCLLVAFNTTTTAIGRKENDDDDGDDDE